MALASTAETIDLTNCDRELVQYPGRILPHGVLLVLREPEMTIVQASQNTESAFGLSAKALWAGDPSKPFQVSSAGGEVLPRTSFAPWIENVKWHSEPWLPLEIAAAEELRKSLVELTTSTPPLRRVSRSGAAASS
jgi:light-regulated signal transduction histidine kinase (bacteriophytochrome)